MPPTWHAWKARNRRMGRYRRAPVAVEWALEWFVYRLRSLALFDLLELAGRRPVVAILWLLRANDRAKERHYRAWDLINAARGWTGDGGRRDALEDLHKDGVSLAGAPLEQTYLPGIDLRGAILELAKLKASGSPTSSARTSSAPASGDPPPRSGQSSSSSIPTRWRPWRSSRSPLVLAGPLPV